MIFAATNGFLDDLELNHCGPFEHELYQFLDTQHAGMLDEINQTGKMSDELNEKLSGALREFTDQFKATHGLEG